MTNPQQAIKDAADKAVEQSRQSCAAQHFGPWMVEEGWFRQAVDAVKAGTYAPKNASPAGRSYSMIGKTAVIQIMGQMTKGESSFGGASSVLTRRSIREAVNDTNVSAILLQIDSPGGTVAGTADLAADVAAADQKKPVYTYFEDLGASAAYWVGSQARQVFANATALVGSIGTVLVLEDTSGAMEKAGVKVHVISTGAYKGAGSDGAPITEQQLGQFQQMVDDLNKHFLAGVAAGRKMTDSQVRNVADGRVFVADQAKTLGLIDRVATLDQVVQFIAQETFRMENPSQAFKAEHPDAYKDIVNEGFTEGHKTGTTEERDRAKALAAAFPDRPAFALEQFVAGHEVMHAKAAFSDVLAAENKTLREEQAKAAAKAATIPGGATPVAMTAATEPVAAPVKPDAADHKAVAAYEWDNERDKCGNFSSKERYVAYRAAVLSGKLRVGGKPA